METVPKRESFWPALNKYKPAISYPLVFLAVAFLVFRFNSINLLFVYIVYSLIYIFGVEIGYHRCLCHSVRYNRYFENFCLWLGSLSHIGPFRESVLYHLHHHANADTDTDHNKTFLTAIHPHGARIQWSRTRFVGPLQRIKNDPFLNWIDHNYYFWLLLNYAFLGLILGPENLVNYVFIPLGFVLLVHRYSAYFYHTFGYRNYQLNDNSRNIFWLLPLVFGENWHNNHHFAPKAPTTKKNWWEWDPAYFLGKPFLVKS